MHLLNLQFIIIFGGCFINLKLKMIGFCKTNIVLKNLALILYFASTLKVVSPEQLSDAKTASKVKLLEQGIEVNQYRSNLSETQRELMDI